MALAVVARLKVVVEISETRVTLESSIDVNFLVHQVEDLLA
jgi:hypothetical protein